MTETTVILPKRDEMLRRLKSVIDEPHTEKGFYSLLLAHAGQSREPEGIALMFILAIGDYTAGLPVAIQQTLNVALPRLVAAIVDDEDVRRKTLEVIQSAQG